MSKTQTDKSRYPSKYSPGNFVTARQYIIELICEKRASNLKQSLPIKFWKQKEWADFYKSQLRRCNVLLKRYDERSIIEAIKETWGIYTLWAKKLEKEINKRYKQKENKVVETEKINRATTNSIGRQTNKTGLLDKLEAIDNE